MTIAKILLGIALASFVILSWRLNQHRLAYRVWKGFRSDPMPLGSPEALDPIHYNSAGKRLLPWLIANLLAVSALGLYVVFG